MGAINPAVGRIVSSHTPFGAAASIAVIGASTAGPLDLPRRGNPARVDSGGPTPFGAPGLTLVAADDQQVDVLDIDDNRLRTWLVGGVVPNPAGPQAIARVTGGWLVVRGGFVDRFGDDAPTSQVGVVDAGSLVFSANGGRDAWIAIEGAGLSWKVEPYDPATGTIGRAVTVGTPVGATNDGLLVTGTVAFLGSEFDLVDRSGRVHRGPVIDSRSIVVLAAAGNHVALLGSGGLFVLDLANGTNRLITDRAVFATALSPDGAVLGWIESDAGDPKSRHVMATRVGGNRVVQLGGPGDRVLVADDGTVLFTSDEQVRAGSVDADGSTPVYGYAPAPNTLLALDYDPPPPNINLGPSFLP
jgi:hypothetical protein